MRVLVATSRPRLGDALTVFLSERSVQVLDVVVDADAALAGALEVRPDVVLVDWSLGEASSARLVAALSEADDPTPVIILSTSDERPRAQACGAAACATLGDHPDSLFAALLEVGPRPGPGAPA